MKKTITLFTLMLSIQVSYGQIEEKQSKIYKNEIGVDVTGFIKYFLTFNQSTSVPYSPTYYLTYRRKFKPGNIRFAFGGNYISRNLAPQYSTDSNNYYYNSYSIDLRLGWEFTNNIGEKSQIYYGIDFRPSYSFVKNDDQYSNAGYVFGYESKTQYYGFAPLLGFRFKVNDRISLTAETSLALIWSKNETRKFTTPTLSIYPELPDDVSPAIKSLYTSFSQPLSIIITFDL